MLGFIDTYTKPNGLAPQIGDNDNGRILVLHNYVGQEYRDHRHILAGGAAVKFLTSRCWPLGRARAATSFVAALLILPVGAAGYVTRSSVSIALLALAAFGIMALMANYLASIQGFSLANVGLVAGVLGALGNVVGALASPAIGRYVDQSGHYHLVFILVSLVPLASVSAMLAADALVAQSRGSSDAP